MNISFKFFLISGIFLLCLTVVINQPIFAHCQVPCGIYDDHARVKSMLEDVKTVEKAMKQISKLAGKHDPQSKNQIVRWVYNKEKHAQNIIATISDYFLTQRVKPGSKDYTERLVKHHSVILAAMKAKQKVDLEIVTMLQENITMLLEYYPEKK